MSRWRIIPSLERWPALVEAVQRPLGKTALLICFGALLALIRPEWLLVMVFVALSTLWPQHRRAVLGVGTLLIALVLPNLVAPRPARTLMTALVFVAGALLYAAARRWPRAPLLARPVALVLLTTALCVAGVGWVPGRFQPDGWLWQLAHALTRYQYFLGYALLDRLSPQADSTLRQVGTFMPFWGTTVTPYPKGAANLRKIEAKDSLALAVTQLKGLKLLLWCLVLTGLSRLFQKVAFQELALPTLQQALGEVARGGAVPGWRCWEALGTNFAVQLFQLSLLGHALIACCRMAGFAALRNTYRPLEARSIAEFWNRYYYYFKELLVDFFYYPAFVRYFRKHPWLRRNFAVVAAVFLGNLYYHLFRDLGVIQAEGFRSALRKMDVYAIQCALLAVAICISQARQRSAGVTKAGNRFGFVSVLLFYCVMFAFVDESFSYPLGVHLRFFSRLLGAGSWG